MIYRVDNKYGIFSGNAFTFTQTYKNECIVEYTKGVYIICVVYVTYMQSIQYHVFGIFWHTRKNVDSNAAKYGDIFVNLKIYNKYIGHDFCNLVIEILFIVFGLYRTFGHKFYVFKQIHLF